MKKYIKSNSFESTVTNKDIEEYCKSGYVGIVSAFRGYLTPQENWERTDELRKLLNNAGFDVESVVGSYKEENMDAPQREQSFVVKTTDDISLNEFRRCMAGFAAKYQQDSYFIIYGLSDNPTKNKTTVIKDKYGLSDNAKVYHYNKKLKDGEIDYSDYSYKDSHRVNSKNGYYADYDVYDVVGELWSRQVPDFDNDDEMRREVVNRNSYTTLQKFSHLTFSRAFSAYSKTIDGDYAIFASQRTKFDSYPARQRKTFSGAYPNTDLIKKSRHYIISTTDGDFDDKE